MTNFREAIGAAKAKLPLPELLVRLGAFEQIPKPGTYPCPLHSEQQGRSFSVSCKDGVWLWNCFGACGCGGDEIDFVERYQHTSNGDAIRLFLGMTGQCADVRATIITPARSPKLSGPARPPNMTDAENAVAIAACERLAKDMDLCARIAKARGWRPETVRGCALDAALGWHDGKLAFIYESGMKLRWKENGERIIRWHFGEPWLWRGAFLSSNSRVVLSEGETDAISVIEAGIEAHGTVIVAMPSAGTFKDGWQTNFAGKDVTLALDNDEAGAKATKRVSELLRPVARELRVVNWRAVRA